MTDPTPEEWTAALERLWAMVTCKCDGCTHPDPEAGCHWPRETTTEGNQK